MGVKVDQEKRRIIHYEQLRTKLGFRTKTFKILLDTLNAMQIKTGKAIVYEVNDHNAKLIYTSSRDYEEWEVSYRKQMRKVLEHLNKLETERDVAVEEANHYRKLYEQY